MKKKPWKPTPPKDYLYKRQNLADLLKTAKFIYQIGETDALRKPSKEVPVAKLETPEYKAKFNYLKKCMRDYRRLTGKGRGVAAVQVGIPERFFVLYAPETKKKLRVFINPKIIKTSKVKYKYPEACMSCNSLIVNAIRPAWIEFTYLTDCGEEKKWTLKDTTKKGRMYNRVVQHEIDHLEGVINIDTVPSKELIFESNEEFYKKAKFQKV